MMTSQKESGISDFTQPTIMTKSTVEEEKLIKQAVLKMNGHILGFVLGFIGALIIFAATNWLILKAGEGEEIGPHLGLLGQFFIGYDVTFLGSVIGAVYAFVLGYLSGLIIGWVYNGIIFLKNR